MRPKFRLLGLNEFYCKLYSSRQKIISLTRRQCSGLSTDNHIMLFKVIEKKIIFLAEYVTIIYLSLLSSLVTSCYDSDLMIIENFGTNIEIIQQFRDFLNIFLLPYSGFSRLKSSYYCYNLSITHFKSFEATLFLSLFHP